MGTTTMKRREINILVACEFSGIVRDAFRKRGFNAISCDLLPSERRGPHVQGSVLKLKRSLRMMHALIAFPPCRYIARSGALHWHKLGNEQELALQFVCDLLNMPIPYKALENPIGCIPTRIHMQGRSSKADQLLHPWQFGHLETKKTCLWLVGLPPLVPTTNLYRETMALPPKQRNRVYYASGGNSTDCRWRTERWKERSRTYQGVADAMAAQWGDYLSAVL